MFENSMHYSPLVSYARCMKSLVRIPSGLITSCETFYKYALMFELAQNILRIFLHFVSLFSGVHLSIILAK